MGPAPTRVAQPLWGPRCVGTRARGAGQEHRAAGRSPPLASRALRAQSGLRWTWGTSSEAAEQEVSGGHLAPVGTYRKSRLGGRGQGWTWWALCAPGVRLGGLSAFAQAGGSRGPQGPEAAGQWRLPGAPKDSSSPGSGGAGTGSPQPLGEGRSKQQSPAPSPQGPAPSLAHWAPCWLRGSVTANNGLLGATGLSGPGPPGRSDRVRWSGHCPG